MLTSRLANSDVKETQFLEGGIIIVGRSTWKEYLQGLHLGWTRGLEKVDKEESLASVLAEDGVFDEDTSESDMIVDKPAPLKFSPLQFQVNTEPNERRKENIPLELNTPPPYIPRQPTLLLLPFLNRIGIKQVPMMLFDFFTRRYDVRNGGEAALQVLGSATREVTERDLAWEQETERYYKSSVHKFPTEIESAQKGYYKELPKRLEVARILAHGEREPTKDEVSFPPPTEVELRAERLKKELRWRSDLAGWEIVKPDTPATWDPRFSNCLSVFSENPVIENDQTNVDGSSFT
jgi:import inner membrane translocase subunit TIM54